jgi:DNA-binding response OmpR family regulator
VTSSSRTILVVEDDETIRAMVVRALSSRYKMVEATDGMQASELLTQMDPPALIICDVMMPRVDGFSLVRLLRKDDKLKGTPVLFLTAKSGPTDVTHGIGLGARHYMTKPFKLPELVERVEKLVK